MTSSHEAYDGPRPMLPDSETSGHPAAGTPIDTIIALEEAGDFDNAAKLRQVEQYRLAEVFATEELGLLEVTIEGDNNA